MRRRPARALVTWAETHGRIEAFGIEGTGSYGAGLARAVHRAGHHVVEVNRGDRRTRRAAGKSDTIDAQVAARSLLAGQSTAIPKTADGAVEMIRQLKITRDTAMKARTTAMNTLKQIIVQAPPVLREALHDLNRSRPAHALRRTPTGPHRHAHRVRQAHPPVARPSVDGSRRGNRAARPAPRASHHRDITDPLRGLRCGLVAAMGRRARAEHRMADRLCLRIAGCDEAHTRGLSLARRAGLRPLPGRGRYRPVAETSDRRRTSLDDSLSA